MKIASLSLLLTLALHYVPATESTYTIEEVSICKNGNQCLNASQKNRIKESDSYTVEVVLKSNAANFLSQQIQAVQLEVSEISFTCARSATDMDNCPSGSSQEWYTMYQNPNPPLSSAVTIISSTRLAKQLTAQQLSWRNNIKKIPVVTTDLGPKFDKPALPSKPSTYQVRLKAENVQFPDWVWGIRVSVYERDGGRTSSAEFKTRF